MNRLLLSAAACEAKWNSDPHVACLFNAEALSVAQTGLGLTVGLKYVANVLPQPSKSWDYR